MKVIVNALGGISVICLLAACQTSQRHATPAELSPEVVRFSGEVPVWIFVPAPSITLEQAGRPAEVVAPPNRAYTTNQIQVSILGRVAWPGTFSLKEGSTVLEGIVRAGGFSSGAFTKRIQLMKASGVRLTLNLRWRRLTNERYWGIWYEEEPKQNIVSPKDTPKDLIHDYILESGDRVVVQTVIL